MPSFVSHNIFAREVLQFLPDGIKNTVNENQNLYLLASQSFDLFKFNISKHKELVTLCQTSHRINTNLYFIELLNIAKETQNIELISFIYGSITHNILDANLHPFIVYKTGIFNGKKETKKYDGLHTLLETQFDFFNYERYYQKSIINKNLKKEFFPLVKVSKKTINDINKVYYDLYNVSAGKYLFTGYKKARNTINIIRKQNMINKLIFPLIHHYKKNFITYYVFNTRNHGYKFFNINHKVWHYPSDINISKNSSIIDLYQDSLLIAKEAIMAANDYIFNNADISRFTSIIGNKAYIRGIDANIIEPLIYFEF